MTDCNTQRLSRPCFVLFFFIALSLRCLFFFFFNDTATTEIYTLSLHDALPISITAFVGAMVGLERSTLPLIGEQDFGLGSNAAVLSFIVAFGLAKAFTNLGAGAVAETVGRRRLLILGWALALPVPLLIAVAPSW